MPKLAGRYNLLFALLVFAGPLAPVAMLPAALGDYVREVDVVPPDEDIGDGYETPVIQRTKPRAEWWSGVDVAVLAFALVMSVWIVKVRRSRRLLLALTVCCLVYFGFYREGCVCPIGAIQNITVALTDHAYTIPMVVLAMFFLPLIAAVFFGRVFCGAACPLGAIQEIVQVKPIIVPRRLDRALGLIKYVYLVLAVWFAIGPAETREFIICRFDPFVGFFRFAGPADMIFVGAVLLAIGIFIGRPYCRYLCPYGAVLAIISRVAWKPVTITPNKELDCGLCIESCPVGAIEKMRAVPSSCLFCARCFSSCPMESSNIESATGADSRESSDGRSGGDRADEVSTDTTDVGGVS